MQVFSDDNISLGCKSNISIVADFVFHDTDQLRRGQRLDISLNMHQNKRSQASRYVIVDVMDGKKHGKYCDNYKLLPETIDTIRMPSNYHFLRPADEFVKHVQKKATKQKQKSKLPLVLSAGIATTLIISSILALPNPFNYIVAIAICGPLSASLLGLRK